MPKYNFLEKGKKLNKNNLNETLLNFINIITKENDPKLNELENAFNKLEKEKAKEKLRYFINNSKKYLNNDHALEFINKNGLLIDARERAFKSWNKLLNDLAFPSEELNKIKLILTNRILNAKYSISQMAQMVKKLIDPKDYDKIKTNLMDYINENEIANDIDSYLNILKSDMSDEEIELFGDEVNNFKTKYEHDIDFNHTTIYDSKTLEIINDLKHNKIIDGKNLKDEEIDDYIHSLNYANYLFPKPQINYEGLEKEKNIINDGANHILDKSVNDNIIRLGYNPKPTRFLTYNDNKGFYHAVPDDEKNQYLKNKNVEINFSNETKEGLKLIFEKLHEYGFDKIDDKILPNDKNYGLEFLINAGKKYQDAINSNDLEERKKAAIYAKEMEEIDVKTKEIMTLIERYLPVNDQSNLAFPKNIEISNNENIPIEYRVNYIKTSQLAALNNIAYFINKKNISVDDFINSPLKYIKEAYEDEYYKNIDTATITNNLHGNDLIFILGAKRTNSLADNLATNGFKMVDSLAYLDKNEENRIDNYAKCEVFRRTIDEPYSYANEFREKIAFDNSLDKLFINPNLNFNDLGIRYYNVKDLKLNGDNNQFDEVDYIENNKESFKDFKDRLDEAILDYMQKELRFVKEIKDSNAMYIKTDDYLKIAQRATSKMLVLRYSEKDDPNYQKLKEFVKNKQNYVNELVNNIGINPKYNKYQDVKDSYNQELIFNDEVFALNKLNNGNKYENILKDYESYIKTQKETYRLQHEAFIREENNVNNRLKTSYDEYVLAERKYQQEVRKIYGAGYKGIVDNTRNERISDAFIKRNNAYNDLESRKRNYLRTLEPRVRQGKIPLSYYINRINQINNNYYNEVPQFFNNDNFISRNDYINLKYKDAILTDEQKDFLYEEYKKLIKEKENDYFSKRYLESKNMILKSNKRIDLSQYKTNNQPFAKIKKDLVEARFLGVSRDLIDELNIGEENSKFDSVDFINRHVISLENYKKNFDNLLLNYIKYYKNNEINKVSIYDSPKFSAVINVAQKAALKHLLIKDPDKSSDAYKELKGFVIDGKNYINKLINNEKELINSGNSNLNEDDKDLILKTKVEDFEINDFEINKNASIFKEFEDFYEANKNNVVPDELRIHERNVNHGIISLVNDINILVDRNTNHQYDLAIAQKKFSIIQLKDKLKQNLNEYYKQGRISNYYIQERFNRIDNNNLTFPSMFKIDDALSFNDYINEKFPNGHDMISKQEKEEMYNFYKGSLEVSRRQFMLNHFLTIKDLIPEKETDSIAYTEYLKNRPNELLLEYSEKRFFNQEELYGNDKSYLDDRENSFIEKVNNYDTVFKKHSDNEIIINKHKDEIDDDNNEIIINNDEVEKIEIKDDFIKDNDFKDDIIVNGDLDEEEIEDLKDNVLYWIDNLEGYKPKELINEKDNNPIAIWVKSFIEVMKDELGSDFYKGEKLDDIYKFEKDDFLDDWVERNAKRLRETFGNKTPILFKRSVDNLSPKDKKSFEKEYAKNVNVYLSKKYYESLFGKYTINLEDKDDIKEIIIKEDIDDVAKEYKDFSEQIKKDLDINKNNISNDSLDFDEININNDIDDLNKKIFNELEKEKEENELDIEDSKDIIITTNKIMNK